MQVKALYGHLETSEKLLRRLEMYTKVQLITETMDTIIQIMAEVLFVLKEINQDRTSE